MVSGKIRRIADDRPLVCGFLKVRNEIIRDGNLYRVIANMKQTCDVAVVCDDASTDGTREYLRDLGEREPNWLRFLIEVAPQDHDFKQELVWKETLLTLIRNFIRPTWVLWMDGDETLDREGTRDFRTWVRAMVNEPEIAWAFPYIQGWRSPAWQRVDGTWENRRFVKLWRWSPDLSFKIMPLLHMPQFPSQIQDAWEANPESVGIAPFSIMHHGNIGVNLRWKAIQYNLLIRNPAPGQGAGALDHLMFPNARYKPIPQTLYPEPVPVVTPEEVMTPPQPFTPQEQGDILTLRDLKALPGWFTVIIPAYNRAKTLPKALDSVLAQTYPAWVCVVLDDGSTDETQKIMREYQERDCRIFYARYEQNRGTVVTNEIGMDLACEFTEYWTRLGSDDWWEPSKLERDAEALYDTGAGACYGPFGSYFVYDVLDASTGGRSEQVIKEGTYNVPMPGGPAQVRDWLLRTDFMASWANIAVRTSVLRAIKAKYGCYGALGRTRFMEDYIINARIARETEIVWRGVYRGEFLIDPDEALAAKIITDPFGVEVEAAWRMASDGASSRAGEAAREREITRQMIREDGARQ